MYATDGRGMEALAAGVLSDLCFIDEREGEASAVIEGLRRYGKLGVVGPFERTFGEDGHYVSEVASVYAEQLHVLGYLEIGRPLSAEQHDWLVSMARDRFEEQDLRRSDVEALIGAPSLVVDKRIGCYAPADRKPGWVFVDYWTEHVSVYDPGTGSERGENRHAADPLVRDVRLPWTSWESGLVLTLCGRYLRWGPGWWLDHKVRPDSPVDAGIAAQLRAIRERDPSQATRSGDRGAQG